MWYENPYFLMSFGAAVSLGFVVFGIAYFVFVKFKSGIETDPIKERWEEDYKGLGIKYRPTLEEYKLSIPEGTTNKKRIIDLD